MTTELKPCPFCGSATATRVIKQQRKSPFVVCDSALSNGCGVTSKRYPTVAEAIAAWNRRAKE